MLRQTPQHYLINHAYLTGTRTAPYHLLRFDLAAQNQKGARYLEPVMMRMRLLLFDFSACYCKVFSQLCCRNSCPYVQRFVARCISTRKDADRLKLLRSAKTLMKSTSNILLISEESKRLGEMSPKEACKLGDEKGMEVVILNRGTTKDVVTCKLFSRMQLEEADKQHQSKSHHKAIVLRSNIDEHDLQIKINKMRQLLDKGHAINLNVLHKPGGRDKDNRNGRKLQRNGGKLQRTLINRVSTELNVSPGKINSSKVNMLTCTLQPNQHNK